MMEHLMRIWAADVASKVVGMVVCEVPGGEGKRLQLLEKNRKM